MKITSTNKEQAIEVFGNALKYATPYFWDKKPDKYIRVTPQCEEDIKKAKTIEKIFNYYFDKLMDIPEFRKKLARQLILNEDISKEELEGYFKQIIQERKWQ